MRVLVSGVFHESGIYDIINPMWRKRYEFTDSI